MRQFYLQHSAARVFGETSLRTNSNIASMMALDNRKFEVLLYDEILVILKNRSTFLDHAEDIYFLILR